jgi:hypothetical protein
MLYHYTIRPESISNKPQSDILDVRSENEILITGIRNRRNNEDLDTFERYFDPIYSISKGLLDYSFNMTSECLKVSFYKTSISAYHKKLLRELFYDFDINFNDHQTNSDWNIFFIDDDSDLVFLESNLYKICDESSGNTQIVITNINEKTEDFKNRINRILSKYSYSYYISEYQIINIMK